MSYLDTPIEATVSEYSPTATSDQIKQMQYDLNIIAKENERFRLDVGSLRKQLMESNAYIESAKDILLEAIEINCVGKDVLINVAEALGIELTKRVEGTATIEVSFSFDAPLDFDIDSFELCLDVEASESCNVDNFDWNEDDTAIDCERI